MEVEDFVETSDVEELQELEEEVKTMLSSSRQRHDSFNSYSPRKRVKLYHGALNPSLEVPSTRSFNDKDDDGDDLLLHTPVKSLSVDRPSSPLTPLSPHSPGLPEAIQEQLLDRPRYLLRHRKVAQLKPYTVDQLKYKEALRANPDAIVKFKNLALRNHHHHPEDRYEEDGETQMGAYIDGGSNDEDGNWEERERRWHQRREEARRKETLNHALPERQQISYPEILQDLSSTDEEEAYEKRTLSKEARRIVKEREKRRKIQGKGEMCRGQELERQQLKRRPFPMFNSKVSNAEAPSDDNHAALEEDYHNSFEHLNDVPRSPDEAQATYDYFVAPIDLDPEDRSHPQSKQPDSSDISDIEIQLPRSKQRALARMLPKSMTFSLIKQAATSFITKKRRSSTPPASGSDDDEGTLLPGHTRTRKVFNPKDLRDIKGDSESEQEIGDKSETSLASQRRSHRVSISDSSSVSDEVKFVHSIRHRRRAQIVDLVSGSGTSSEDEMDDLTIQAHIADSHTPFSGHSARQSGSGRLRDVSLIDWMLTRTRTIGGKQRKQGSSGRKRTKDRSSKYKFDVVTLGIPLLHSGKSFGLSTSIRKGWLHELLGLVTSAQEPTLPPSINSCGFELGPTIGADKLVSILQDICSTLFEFVTDLPDADSDNINKGAAIMRVVPMLVSWFSKTEDEGVSASLREAGEREIERLVAKIQKLTLPFVDMPILATCWFAVELCARLGCRLEGQPPTGILKESAMTLIRLLLQVGLEKPITIVKSDTDMTEPSVPHFAAELWVSLIHLLGECDSLERANRRIHPFWLLLMTAIQSQPEGQKPRTNLEASETIWYTIFGVCALSQYSVHGMTTGVPRLAACWDLVVFVLKKIRLNEDPKADVGMPSAMLLQRDKYIGLIMTRCFHLRERWRWKLDDASILFNQLAVIFRSRKFANLRHEGTGYPKFFKDRNWDLLESYDPKDTAFVLFVKLIVQAAKDDQGSIQGKLSLKTKKLLSLAVPVASLPFSKTNPPTLHELTMFYNRLCAVAIAVYLELDEYDSRTRQAREYIKFADADDTTRSAVIGGMMNWAIMMVNREIRLDAMTTWIEEMAQVLSAELKETSSLNTTAGELNNAKSLRRDRLVLLSCVLLGAVRHILKAYIGLGQYPEPSLLLSLRPIMHSLFNKDDSKAQEELGLLADSFFSARSAAMPPPARPVRAPARVVDEDNGEESQDYGIMDIEINWSSVDIPEALAVDNEKKPSSNNASHDKTLVSILAGLGFRWIMYRFLKPYLVPPPPSASFHAYAKQCDMWLRCAVGCTCMEIGDHKWDFWFKILDPHFTQVDDRWVRRVKLSLMLKILRADPMAYLMCTDRFIDVYLHALGSDSTILEKDYVPFLLSIDNLQHPLLCNAQCLPGRSPESGDYEFTVEQFLELRLPLLQVVFGNLDRLLREQHAGNVALRIDNDQYLAKCREVFSVMRNTRASLEGTKYYSDYNNLCIKVFQSLQEYPTLRIAENISFWVDLGRVNS